MHLKMLRCSPKRYGRSFWLVVFGLYTVACSGEGDPGVLSGPKSEVVFGGTIDNSQGGTLTVQNGGRLDGLSITAPPNSFSKPTVKISISTKDIPNLLSQQHKTDGVVQGSDVVSLVSDDTTPFENFLQVSLPYDKVTVTENDHPVVAWRDEHTGEFEILSTIAIDRTAGIITFQTNHFSDFVVLLARPPCTPLSLFTGVLSCTATAGDFSPVTDGFSVKNFSTQFSNASRFGVCYGQAAFVKWYHKVKRPVNHVGLYHRYKYRKDPKDPSISQVDDLARELAYEVFDKSIATNLLNGLPHFLPPTLDGLTLRTIVTAMVITQKPQIIGLYERKIPFDSGDGHAAVAYKWDPSKGLSIYDPNYPYDPANPKLYERAVTARLDHNGLVDFDTYDGFQWITFAEPLLSVSPAPNVYQLWEFEQAYSNAEAGWPNRRFSTLSILSPTPKIDSSGTQSLVLSNTVPTEISVRWDPGPEWDIAKRKPSFAHIYLNGSAIDTVPIPPPSTDGSREHRFTYSIPAKPADSPPYTLIEIAISTRQNPDKDYLLPQDAVSEGYHGFLRAKLVPADTLTITGLPPSIQSTFQVAASWAFPSIIQTTYIWVFQSGHEAMTLNIDNDPNGHISGFFKHEETTGPVANDDSVAWAITNREPGSDTRGTIVDRTARTVTFVSQRFPLKWKFRNLKNGWDNATSDIVIDGTLSLPSP